MTTTTIDRPNLELARQFTRDLGPATMIAGALIAVHGLVLYAIGSAYTEWFVFPYGLLVTLFGAAAYTRTETTPGQLLRWAVVAVFVAGGGFSLYQWAHLIWGGGALGDSGNVMMVGFYLMAGPALLVPAGLAVVRPGWVPLIVTPAIVSMLGAAILGYGTMVLMDLMNAEVANPLPDTMLMGGVILASAAVFLYSAQRGLTIARQRE